MINRNIILLLSAIVLVGCSGSNTICGYDEYGDPIYCPVTSQASYYSPQNGVTTPPVSSTLTFPVQQSLRNIASTPYSFNVSASDGVNSYNLQYNSTPVIGNLNFNGVISPAQRIETLVITENGVPLSSSNKTIVFQTTNPLVPLGSFRDGMSSFEVDQGVQILPAFGLVGQIYPYFSGHIYRDSAQSVLDATTTESISLQPDTATTALLCSQDDFNLTPTGNIDQLSGFSQSTCFRIDSQSNVLGVVLTIPVNGSLLNFQ